MIKVRILDRCEFCDGEAYIFECEDVDAYGEIYARYRPCGMCRGTGNRSRWIDLRDFADLLERATLMEPDYLELARENPTSQYQDSRDAAGI